MSETSTFRFLMMGTGQSFIACAELLLSRSHAIVGVVSDCPDVSAWSVRRGIARTPVAEQSRAATAGAGFDYLLSIVNHAIVSPGLLAAPTRGAINYHDSLLPAYAGFNATSWSILEGQRTHGVTWHRMSAEADRGAVLIQQPIDIGDDDTAFSLGVRCSEACVATFATLVSQIEGGLLAPREQQGTWSFHLRSERPGLTLLDPSRPAAELHALVRALSFGSEDNWMSTPKLALPGGFVSVLETRTDPTTDAAPGTIVSVGPQRLAIATANGLLVITEVSTLEGEALEIPVAAERFGLREGQRLSTPDAALIASGAAFDAVVTKSERFWMRRLVALRAATLPGVTSNATPARPAALERALPSELAGATAEHRASVLAAALGAFVHRLGGGDAFDFALAATVPDALRPLYATATPMHCAVSAGATFSALVAEAAGELAQSHKRGTFARDIRARYGALRGRAAVALPLGLGLSAGHGTATLVDGTAITLAIGTGAHCTWSYDAAAISLETLQRLVERFDVLLAAGLADGESRVASLPLLPAAERALLLTTWQQTDRPHDAGICVHELIAQQVERTPDAIAVAFGKDELTYWELDRRANALAHTLRGVGVGPEVLVGLFAERSLDMIVSLLGIMKAGGAYVPMDPAYPRDRLAIMLEDSKARVVVTQSHLVDRLPASGAELVLVDRIGPTAARDESAPESGVRGEHLAYVIFTSGSTGRPKGTMLEHRNVTNFFVGMDEAVGRGAKPGVWLAVTSISFDISVLELFWTLARGFKVVIAPESDRATLEQRDRHAGPAKPMGFGLFYFSADSGSATPGKAYRLLLEGAKYADKNGFDAVWTPERHFHAFGGLYPNASVTTAALSTITDRVQLRAGSIVLPLHDPLRVAEDWAVIDQLSNGRVGLSVASGWHVNDFAFKPDNYERRREVMLEYIETVLKLWRGEKVSVRNGAGETIEVAVLPRPVQASPPLWIASAGSVDTFILAGRIGANVLTNMLGQDLADLKNKFAAYRKARREAGFEGDGIISVMLHTFVCGDSEEARRLARKPFSNYLASSFDLVKVAPKMFPAFRQPSRAAAESATIDSAAFSPEDMEALLEHAFDRYFDTAGLFGTPERAMEMVDRLSEIGANEMACLVDFGIDPEVVLASLPHLKRLKDLCAARAAAPVDVVGEPLEGIGALMQRHGVTHFQCTPSMARVLAGDPDSLAGLARLERLMLGGEALPTDLAAQLAGVVSGTLLNMYGPTETTVWSTTAVVDRTGTPTIGRPIANTTIRVLDEHQQLVPVGTPGELYIGGAGVARGYLDRLELTAQRFVPDPFADGARLYRTGDLVRYRADGELEFLGRLDHQVKISGHRIELGEIETALTRHPSVHHGVVVARAVASNGGAPALVAYVVPSNRGKSGADDADRVRSWETLWDETYKAAAGGNGPADPRFVIAGWNDSYAGEPIPPTEMREWLDTTVDRIRALGPRRVLEIGCGTGLILYRVAPHVEHYTGVDISQQALRSIAAELTPAESAKVTLLQQPAHALEQVPAQSCDLVIINSVAQYFPDADYLVRVLRRATELVADGGSIFVGDVRSFAHLGAFHGSIEVQQAAAETAWPELRERIERRVARDSELVLAEAFFHALVRETPRLQGVEVELKRGRARNELTAFRYDVVLRVGPKAPTARPTGITPAVGVASLDDVRAKLAVSPAALYLVDVPNARLASLTAAIDTWPKGSPGDATAGRLRERLAATPDQGIDPEALYTLRDDYDVQIRWAHSGDPARFDAVLRHRERGARAAWPWDAPAHAASPTTYANTPIGASDDATLISQLREHLRRGLPEYMVPATFVVLDALPLTPNGKIDRNALPAPEPARLAVPAASFVPPTNDLEQRIAAVWQELLGIERVGRQDNIFDLGANSLLTMQANNRLSSVLGRKVSLVSMFRYPTVASLAAHLGEGTAAAPAVDTKAQERASRAEQAAERRRALRAERSER